MFKLLKLLWLIIFFVLIMWNWCGFGFLFWVSGVIVFILMKLNLSLLKLFIVLLFLFVFVVKLIGFLNFKFIILVGFLGIGKIGKGKFFINFKDCIVKLCVVLGCIEKINLWMREYIFF